MRSFILLILPLAALAVPSPFSPVKHLLHRDHKIPYVVENGCDQYQKILIAVKAARQLAQDAIDQVAAVSPTLYRRLTLTRI
jgi:hypothetical protein